MAERRHNLPKKLHLRSKKDFDAVFDARTKESRGPLSVHARPNGLAFPRLGMSVSRKVGNAVKRNRIRRLIREAFRLMQHDWPAGYDLVTVVRPHGPLPLAEYQRILAGTVAKLHVTFTKRAEAAAKKAASVVAGANENGGGGGGGGVGGVGGRPALSPEGAAES
ncbi:MAG TPA: ribonuclease P protein component [Humisphaera sp.]